MKLGAHISISGGVFLAPVRAVDTGCEALQVFTKNASRWAARPLEEETAAKFREELSSSGIKQQHAVAHDSYLINLASPKPDLHEKSLAAIIDEYKRTEMLGLAGLVFHPGSSGGSDENDALSLVGQSLDFILGSTPDFSAKLLIETTAGQGTSLGWNFEQIALMIERAGSGKNRVGVCVDTCHIFAAGYDFRTRNKYIELTKLIDSTVGLDKVMAFHLNDSKKELGSRVDRHAHIGRGFIGREPFGFFLNDDRFENLPGLLETPKIDAGEEMDPANLAELHSLEL